MESARVLIEVVGGMIPEQPMEDFHKRWGITSKEWEEATQSGGAMQLILDRLASAQAYYTKLCIDSASGMAPNWVRLDWVWL